MVIFMLFFLVSIQIPMIKGTWQLKSGSQWQMKKVNNYKVFLTNVNRVEKLAMAIRVLLRT